MSPVDAFALTDGRLELRPPVSADDWDAVERLIREHRVTDLHAGGQMTDAALARLARLNELTDLHLEHSAQLTDAGVAELRACDRLRTVSLLGTATGDGAIEALVGKPHLRRFASGRFVTDAGLRLFHRYPMFAAWQGGEPEYSLMSAQAGPTHLLVDGQITDAGLASLAGLDGLFGFSLFWHTPSFTAAGLRTLARLPNLGFLGCDGKRCDDDAMRAIATLPGLRMLAAQGAVATDQGFEALSLSPTIEYVWGRECPNLTGRGFTALTAMPALRGLAVSCKQVDDAALAALPRAPGLTELMPMDVTDEGFRHVGRCEGLKGLWCMYCRDTTDAATEQVARLSRLRTYYAGKTRITDRSLELLARMPSLERIELWSIDGITDAGIAALSRLANLREITVESCRGVTDAAFAEVAAHVRVRFRQ